MTFITYENYQNRHICIHKFPCNQISKNGGNENYREFNDIELAEKYAAQTNLPIRYCSFCSPLLGKQNKNDAKWGLFTFQEEYAVIHRTDCKNCPDGNWRLKQIFDSSTEAESVSGTKIECPICQELIRHQQAVDLPGIIGKIVMEKSKLESIYSKSGILASDYEKCRRDFDFIMYEIMDKSIIHNLEKFDKVFDDVVQHIDEYETEIANESQIVNEIKDLLKSLKKMI